MLLLFLCFNAVGHMFNCYYFANDSKSLYYFSRKLRITAKLFSITNSKQTRSELYKRTREQNNTTRSFEHGICYTPST